MRKRHELHGYQERAAEHVVEHPRSVLTIPMGLGKTCATLTAIRSLFSHLLIRGVLVVAPRRVAETVWHTEAKAWEHTAGFDVCILRGNKALAARNLMRPYHIWVINYESLPWLFTQLNKLFLAHGKFLPFDMIVFDELTRVKNFLGQRIRPWYGRNASGYCMMDHFQWRVGLTGTPAPNGYIDLFGQYYAIDGGSRLGGDLAVYKSTWFTENVYAHRLEPIQGAREQIQARIADITLAMRAEDYLRLPPYVISDIEVDLPPAARSIYDQMEAELFAELESTRLEVHNAAAATAKCRQIANGAVLDPQATGLWHPVHEAKLEALDDIMEEAAGNGVLIAYIFRADMQRIMERYKNRYRIAYLGPGVSDKDAMQIVNEWNAGLYDAILGHPASIGHGLNLQHGGNIVAWFGQNFALEEWLQFNARLRRQGQTAEKVFVYRIVAKDTVDQVVREAIDRKETDQAQLHDALIEYRRRRLSATPAPTPTPTRTA